MPAGPETLLSYIRRLVPKPSSVSPPDPGGRHGGGAGEGEGGGDTTDAALLGRFISQRDERAFAALVDRHGALVLQVCRRILGDVHDAEDAFQAVFLILARKAATVHRREALPAWLHGVARRVALKARRKDRRWRIEDRGSRNRGLCLDPRSSILDPRGQSPDPLADISGRELLMIIDEELQRLPEVYRLPVILCCLEGRCLEEAARQLGWTRGSVKGRLERGRARLQDRLVRRGLTLSAALAAAEVSRGAVSAATVRGLVAHTVRGAVAFGAGQTAATTGVSVEAVALAGQVIKGMALAKCKLTAVLMLTLAMLTAAVGVGAQRGLFAQAGNDQPVKPDKPLAQSTDRRQKETPVQVRTDAYGDPLPKEAIARVGTARLRHGSQIYCVAFSPDGRFITSGSYHGDLCLWDRTTGKLLCRLADPSKADSIHWVTAVAFSPDGKMLASNKGKARLWEVRSGKLLSDPDRNLVGAVGSMPFSPDGKTLVLGTPKGIRLYDLATGKASQPIPGYTAPVTAAVFSKNGKVLASGSTDKTVRIWDLVTGQEIHRFEPNDRVVEVALAPDGQLLAAQTTKEVFLWEVATGKEAHRFQAERSLRSMAFSPDGTRLASANTVWDVTTRKEVCRLEGLPSTGLAWGHDDKTLVPVTGGLGPYVTGALAFAPDGKVLATGGYDGVIRSHDPVSGKELPQAANAPWNRGRMAVCGFDPGGRWLAVRDNGGIHLCETASGKEIHLLPMEDDHGVSVAFPLPVALSPDGRTVIAAGVKGIYRWDTATGKELGRIPNARKREDLGPMAALAFAPDGRTFACAHYEPTIRLWDAATGKELRKFQGDNESPVYRLSFSPDGHRLVSIGNNQSIRLWDLAKGTESEPVQNVSPLAFSPDGKIFVAANSATERQALVLYDLGTGKMLRHMEVRGAAQTKGSPIGPNYCAFSPDGRLLAVDADPIYYPDRERTIQVLEVASGKVRARFAGHFGFPEPMLFSPDGKMLATGSSDTTALIWDVTGRRSDGRLRREKLSADGLKALWSGLAADDGQAAHRAIWTLAAAPGQALSLLKEKMPPIQTGISPRINELIEALDSNQFAVREKVSSELEELGDSAEPALRKALADNPPLEVGRRIERILGKMDVSPRRLQTLRAVEVLEHIATPEAGELLRALAQGDPKAPLTQEAKVSWQRLAKRPAGRP